MRIKFTLAFVATVFTTIVIAQVKKDGYTMVATPLYDAYDVKIEIGYKIPKKPCDTSFNGKKAKFALFVTNHDNLRRINNYLNWKIDFVNCNNDVVEKTVSIDISNLNEGKNENLDWDMDATQIENDFYSVRNESFQDFTKDKVKSKALSVAADSIIGNTDIILGETVTMKVVGGALTKDAKWVWYSGDCSGGVKEGEGPVLVKSNINKNTFFYVRGEGLKNTTSCVFKQVVVDNNSRPAEGIQGKSVICSIQSGEKTLLYVLGGKKGLNANWVWYRNNCNGQKVGVGDSIFVSPPKTTTYFVRAEGPTISPTNCISHTLQVVEPSIKPTNISVSQVSSCANQPVILTVLDGNLSKEAQWVWRSQGKTNDLPRDEGRGSSITVYPDEQTDYFVSAQDDVCPSTDEANIQVSVQTLSVEPTSIQVQKIKKNRYSLSLIGGVLGENSKWVWYKGSCENGDRITSNETSIDYKAKKGDNTIYVRAEGECNKTSCVNTYPGEIEIIDGGQKKNFWFLNGGLVGQNTNQFNNLVLTLGCRWVYVSTKLALENGQKYSYNNIGINESLPSGTTYQYTGNDYYSRTSFTGGFLIGGGNIRIYLGGGVGTYQDIKEFNIINLSSNIIQSTQYARKENGLNSGIEAEGGILIRMGPITLMGGTSSIFIKSQNTPFMDYHLSIGLKL